VVDASDAAHEAQMTAVERILGDLGLGEKRRLLVFNKCDRLPAVEAEALARAHGAFAIAAVERETTLPLLHEIERILWTEDRLVARDP
jgi:GTP-binding protein HflX